VLQRFGAFIRSFLLAAEDERDAAFGIEFDHHVRALVGDPDVVLLVDFYGVCKRPSIEMMANFAEKLSVRAEFQELRGGCAISGPRGAAAREHKNMSFRIDRHAGDFAKVEIRGKLQKVRRGVETDFRRLLRKRRRGKEQGEKKK